MSAIEPIEIILDKPRKMEFTIGALRRAQREINRLRGLAGPDRRQVFQFLTEEAQKIEADQTALDPDFIAVMLWASLLKDDPSLTIEQVDDFPIGLIEAFEAIFDCARKTAFRRRSDQEEEGDSNTRPLRLNGGLSYGHSPESSSE